MSPRLLVLFATALCACSGNVDVDPPTTGTGGSGGQSTASTGGGGAGGTGGDVFAGGGGAGGSMTTSSAGGGPACDGGVILLDVDQEDDGPLLELDSSCPSAPPGQGASGVIGYLGKGSPPMLILAACTMPAEPTAASSLEIWSDLTGPGTTQEGQADLVWFGKQVPETTDISLEITDFGPVGGKITGSFVLTYMENGQPYTYSGTLDVCRRPDYPPPP